MCVKFIVRAVVIDVWANDRFTVRAEWSIDRGDRSFVPNITSLSNKATAMALKIKFS